MNLKAMFPKSRRLNPLPKPVQNDSPQGLMESAKTPIYHPQDFSPEKQTKLTGEALRKFLEQPIDF